MAELLRVLITGGSGQVGRALLAAEWPTGVALSAPGRDRLDLTDPASVRRVFEHGRFDAVVNAGAWTAVDRAEHEVAAAFAVNALGPAVLADLTRASDTPLIQVSTDYVFDGRKAEPYVEDDPTGPLGVYGASKLAGELAVLRGHPRAVVLRTSWVLSAGEGNFLTTMLRLARERPSVRVVADQHGCPTSARDLAGAVRDVTLRQIRDRDAPGGVFHFANAGQTSWAGLAREIFARSTRAGGPAGQVEDIATADYPTPARRPANSRLACDRLMRDYGITPRPWTEAVADILAELDAEGKPA